MRWDQIRRGRERSNNVFEELTHGKKGRKEGSYD